MRFYLPHLLKAPVGTSDEVQLDIEDATLGNDLYLHYLRGSVKLARGTDGILAEGQLDVAFDSECVRCLTPFPLKLDVYFNDLTFAFPHVRSRDYLYRVSEDGWIDLGWALREQILLNAPLCPLCRADCLGLCSQCGQDLNVGACDCHEQTIDPRLAVLGKLL